jgi:hypothetical protein
MTDQKFETQMKIAHVIGAIRMIASAALVPALQA